jgi:prepilin-type N-terminal cleavage/methylation domain-containing protein
MRRSTTQNGETRARSALSRGYSLIELMIVVSIIGFLASVAVPTYLYLKNKSKFTERDNMVRAIELAMIAHTAARDQYPNLMGPSSFLFGGWNPAWPPEQTKRNFDTTLDNWGDLDFKPLGSVYFSYQVFGFQSPASSYFDVFAASDLDGDGQVGWRHRRWAQVTSGWDVTIDSTWGDI